ncbi:RHS repeat-associated core domain-containing protein [Pseudomonas sp. 21LCFQ02]|uniref:RHS repeat-associated core domain-containing protein n=1 Tax=unclassified Pseudomonas TaxID=196821 RepID=UPI00209AEA51|nr:MULTISPECIES: RHS repeat-associated core domain-containing protein [unclassified Pseudomonas]MCO8168325.1 RHS repeat-associated core domain-containing protein [Pseudomonas sp. 21LCFQ02]MCQ9426260.1 RHS repeat-associated core domain-containing protein [Pseudomonas sp. LJDD11]
MPAHNWLCRYQYDALDRLAGRLPGETSNERCFYQEKRLTTIVQQQRSTSWLNTAHSILSQQQREQRKTLCALVGSDPSGSVIHSVATSGLSVCTYAPYGHRHPVAAFEQLPGFNRERADPVTGHYLLGSGFRSFNPVLMRFNSPDDMSPFTEGALNAYAYCVGDPINRFDPTGHLPTFLKKILRPAGLIRTRSQVRMQSYLRDISPRASVASTDTLTTVVSDSQDFDLIQLTRQSSQPAIESRSVVELKPAIEPTAKAGVQPTTSSSLGMDYWGKRAASRQAQISFGEPVQSRQASVRGSRSVQKRP